MAYFKASIQEPRKLLLAGRFDTHRSWAHGRRTIDSYEIIVGIRGPLYLQEESRRFTVKKGDVLILRPGCLHHGFAPSPDGASFYWMHVADSRSCSVLEDAAADAELSRTGVNPYFDGLFNQILIPQFFHPDHPERLEILIRQLMHIRAVGYYSELGADYALTSFLIELTEQARAHHTAQTGPRSDKISQILAWIDERITQTISLREAAQAFNYSDSYLSRYFHRHTGMTMQQYIHIRKMAQAKEHLSRTDDSIRSIAVAVGFRDEKYFMRLFKRYEQITPMAYRNAYRQIVRNGS